MMMLPRSTVYAHKTPSISYIPRQEIIPTNNIHFHTAFAATQQQHKPQQQSTINTHARLCTQHTTPPTCALPRVCYAICANTCLAVQQLLRAPQAWPQQIHQRAREPRQSRTTSSACACQWWYDMCLFSAVDDGFVLWGAQVLML